MNLDELATLMGKTRAQVEELLKHDVVIELKLKDKAVREPKDTGSVDVV